MGSEAQTNTLGCVVDEGDSGGDEIIFQIPVAPYTLRLGVTIENTSIQPWNKPMNIAVNPLLHIFVNCGVDAQTWAYLIQC